MDQAVIKVKPRQPAWQHRYLWSKHVFAKHPRCNIKDISGSGSEAMQMRSHPFGNVHHMQLEISPGYTEPFVPLKTEEFHSDVHPMAPNPLPTPPQESLTRVQQLFNLASQCHKDGKTLKKKKTSRHHSWYLNVKSSISFHIQKQVRNSRRCCSEAFA